MKTNEIKPARAVALFAALAAAGIAAGCCISQKNIPANMNIEPNHEAAPAPAFSPEKIAAAVARIEAVTGDEGARGVVLASHGEIIWSGAGVDEKKLVWSCTKSFLSTCLGLLWDDGTLSPDDPAAKFAPEFADSMQGATLRHMATFTSGINFDEKAWTIGKPNFPLGTAYHYSSTPDLLALILTRAAGMPLAELFRQRIAVPLGIEDHEWEWRSAREDNGIVVNGGTGYPESGVCMTPRALAKFGMLFANDGVWDGKRLLSERYLAEATRVRLPADTPMFDPKAWYASVAGRYGLNWWVNGPDAAGKVLWPHATERTFAAQGNQNNICIIIPERRFVLARVSADQIIDIALFDEAFEVLFGE